jgi:hypothetical protein
LSVRFLTPGDRGRPKLRAWKRLAGRESHRSPVPGHSVSDEAAREVPLR